MLSHHWVAYFDNLSEVPAWLSDILCCAVTGAGFSKRELYSDDDDVTYAFRRCLGLNGINVVATRSDLLDRSILLRLGRIPRERRRGEKELLADSIGVLPHRHHVVGGLHHQKPFDWYKNVISVIHETHPNLHIKAWTPVEINWFSYLTKKPIAWVLEQMIDAGLGSMPGGGAEIFDPEVRQQICEHKSDADNWMEVHREAHRLGLATNATMLYGHIEKTEHRVDHLCRLRKLQDETGGFQTFIPLAFHPENTGLSHLPKATGLLDLKIVALSRLMLDNFPHIKAYWVMLGEKTAQVALGFGADDIDGTVVHELIYHDAGATTPQGLSVAQLHGLIREAGRIPVERDTLYRRVIRNGSEWSVGEPLVAESTAL